MTPAPPARSGGGFLAGLSIGLAITALFLCLGGAVGYVYVKKLAVDARKGWNLVPVVVAAQDLAEGTTVTMEMISQRSVPEQFVTSSVVKPDSASYVINQKILVPVQAGDPLLWSQFETTKQTTVLFAAKDIAAGSAFSAEDTVEGAAPDALLTDSWVRASDRPQANGRRVLAAFRKGDPIFWTHLAAPGAK